MKALYAMAIAPALIFLSLTGLASAQTYTYSTFANFPSNDGPIGANTPLTIDDSGNLYGSSEYGGTHGFGTVFKVTSKGVLSTLYSFGTNDSEPYGDGAYPADDIVREKSNGNLYGLTSSETAQDCPLGQFGCGVVFEVTPAGVESIPYTLPGCGGGASAYGGATLDSAGDLYGEYYCDDYPHEGDVVFKMTPKGKVTNIYTETTTNDSIASALILNSAGDLYGYGFGLDTTRLSSIIKIAPRTGQLTTVYTFAIGITPSGKLTQDAAGNLYGATYNGGTNGGGTLFKYSAAGVYSVLYNFGSQSECADGITPFGWLTLDSSGNLYGLTSQGGAGGCTDGNGVIFKVTSKGEESLLYDFTCFFPDGNLPSNGQGLVADASGNLYGASECIGDNGSIYKLTKN
jgi:uncharacterized repeat protein (TIGR03803 family)